MKRDIGRKCARGVAASSRVWLVICANPRTGVDVGYKERAPDYKRFHDHHDFWELLYVDGGSVRLALDQQEQTVGPGKFVVIAPRQLHSMLPSSGVANFYITAHFDTNLEGLNELKNAVITADEHGRQLLIDMLIEKRSKKFGADALVQCLLLEFLVRTIRRHRDQAEPVALPTYYQANADQKIVGRAIEYLTVHFAQRQTVNDVARAVGVSSSQLEHLFKKITTVSMMSFLQDLRIQSAKRLLLESPLNVSQIAEKVGYASIHLFSRRFKKAVSIPPSRYAKMVSLAARADNSHGQIGSKNG